MNAVDRAQKLEEEFGPKQKQLSLWGENVRGMSKSLARSALFAVRDKREPRVRYEDHIVASLQNITMKYSGAELRQDDHDVFMQLCHLARTEEFGATVQIAGLDALKGLGWGRSKEDYERLGACYKRLLEGTVYVTTTGAGARTLYGSHLLHSVGAEHEGDPSVKWTIVLNANIANIMTGDEMTLIDWVRNYKLTALAKWLHRFYSTHEVPLPYKVATLHSLCGSKQRDLRGFRLKLRRALDELVAASFVSEYRVEPRSDLVHVLRASTTKAINGQRSA